MPPQEVPAAQPSRPCRSTYCRTVPPIRIESRGRLAAGSRAQWRASSRRAQVQNSISWLAAANPSVSFWEAAWLKPHALSFAFVRVSVLTKKCAQQ